MLSALRTLAALVVLPPGSILLMLTMGLVLARPFPRLAKALQISGIFALYLLSTPVVSSRLLAGLEPAAAIDAGQLAKAKAIVVLSADIHHGTPEYGGDTVGGLTLQRMRYGAKLERASNLPILVSGGPIGDSPLSLAALMVEVFREDFGVAPRWIEDRSLTTADNAAFSAAILRPEGITTIALVTDAWHMPRARRAFEANGMTVIPAPTMFTSVISDPEGMLPDMRALHDSFFALHEWLGWTWYRVRYAVGARP